MVNGYQYQDYNKINFDMLRDMQQQIRDMKRWQEKINGLRAITDGESSQQSLHGSLSKHSFTNPSYSNNGDFTDAYTQKRSLDYDDDDDDDESDCSYIPDECELESFSDESSDDELDLNVTHKATPELKTPVNRRQSKGTPSKTNSSSSRGTRRVPDSSPSHNYNLRSRGNTLTDIQNGSFLTNMPSPSKLKELIYNVQQASGRRYTAVIRKPRTNNTDDSPLFSSDEDC